MAIKDTQKGSETSVVGVEPKRSKIAEREEELLEFWRKQSIFKKSLEKEAPKGEFVFYEGPPTANGRPGIHHIEGRAFKDVIPRYKTMQGYHVRRKGGWDTHGLPVELQVEKELGLTSKKDIEKYGIVEFNRKCRESVWQYMQEWQKFTDRIGFWVDQENPYITYEPSYIESVWNILSEVHKKGLICKDYKVVPWCPRCGTALSSHELAQGYATVKDISVYVKFRVKNPTEHKLPENTYIVAWTTTPWTLPGNVALAVGKNIVYTIVEQDGESLIVAKNLQEKVFGNTVSGAEFSAEQLIGLEYEPLYPYLRKALPSKEEEKLQNAYKVYAADFVGSEDGTGIVHTAVMYGADDFALGTAVGLPKVHLINETGEFISETDFLAGKNVRDVAIDIIKDLHERGLLLKKEKIEHTYPHCWRCKTPLIYFARDSWYIRMSALKEELVKENAQIHWEPEHIRDGRFGEWLREIKDWAISRERYWGTPLPFWKNAEGKLVVIDSVATLKKYTKKSGNIYTIMRHGEADNNVANVLSARKENAHHLTVLGKEQVAGTAEKLKDLKITKIVASPFMRTQETARIVAEKIGISAADISTDDRLSEYNVGDFDGKSTDADDAFYTSDMERFEKPCPNGESLADIKRRTGDMLYELEEKYENEHILIISHSTPLWMLYAAAHGLARKEAIKVRSDIAGDFIITAGFEKLDFTPLPHNEEYELDLHRPYIDEHVLIDENGNQLARVPEVLDVWFDSGAMPFAQDHYPMDNKEWIEGAGFPADYIAEAIDQTRGWFYTLHAIGILMGRGKAYKNVICLGHILDAEGKKMSKSLGNVVNPWEMMDKYGVDALRFWMFTVNQPGESKNFDEKTVDEIIKKVFNPLLNVMQFYDLYAEGDVTAHAKSAHVLDRWILSRLRVFSAHATRDLNDFRLLEPARGIRDFILDFSQWYIRRSRDRMKSDDAAMRQDALATTRYVLLELSKMMAPLMPFLGEHVYQHVKKENDVESVHLAAWPEQKEEASDKEHIDAMAIARALVSVGLEARAKSAIKVRQPLGKVVYKTDDGKAPAVWGADAGAFIKEMQEELNVKEIEFRSDISSGCELDTNLTQELLEEGTMREIIRMIQDVRKRLNLKPKDTVIVTYEGGDREKEVLGRFEERIRKTALVREFRPANVTDGEKVEMNNLKYTLKVST